MNPELQQLLLNQLKRLEDNLDAMRTKQEETAIQAAKIEGKVDSEGTRMADLDAKISHLHKSVGNLKVDMAVTQAKAGGIAGLLGGGLLTVIIKVIELLSGQ